jgi:hypothetical protein
MASDQTVLRVEVHQLPGAFELRAGKIRPVAQHRLDPLIVDGVRPSGLDQSMQGQPHEHVAQGRWIKRAGIEQDDGRLHGSLVSETEPLAFGGKFIERGAACGVLLFAV